MFDGIKAQSERNYEICADDLRFVERNDSYGWMNSQIYEAIAIKPPLLDWGTGVSLSFMLTGTFLFVGVLFKIFSEHHI